MNRFPGVKTALRALYSLYSVLCVVLTLKIAHRSKYTKVNSLAEIDAAVAPALDKLDKRATPVISTTLKVTEEKIATPLAPLVKYFAKFLPVKTTEKAGVWALAVFMKNLEKLQNMLLIKEETPESE